MTAKHFQGLINQVKTVVNEDIGVLDENGVIIACSNMTKIGKKDPSISKVVDSDEPKFRVGENLYFRQNNQGKMNIITFIRSKDKDAEKILAMFHVSAISIKQFYDDKYDRINFFKNILLDNILPGDIPIRSRELSIQNNVDRVVYVIRAEKIDKNPDITLFDFVTGLFPNRQKDYVISMEDDIAILVKEINNVDDYKSVQKIASKILSDSKEIGLKLNIGIGSVVTKIKEIGASYKEAQMALLIGGIFSVEKPILNYNSLGIGRLIFQSPRTLCKLFLNEVFKDKDIFTEVFDEETRVTVEKFFENNLNVSETSRQLFIHRNTLVYRLDKIQKLTGLDLRMFDDAITFKVATLVKRYLDMDFDSVV